MSSYELVSGTDNLILDGRAYRVGDSVPLSKDQKASLERSGHRFADTDPDAVAAAIAEAPPVLAETMPRGDRGEVLDLPAPRQRATAAPAPATKSD